jgi:transporter family protein
MGSFGWIGLGLVAALGGAGVAIFGKVGLAGVDPTLATTLRSVVMTVMLLGVSVAAGVLRPSTVTTVGGRAWTFILLAGFSGAISWLAYFAALRIGAAAQVSSIDRLSLAFVMLFAVLFLGERYGWRGWTGVTLVVVGILLIVADSP